ncbi:5-methyltetrahydrofolate--homocysteine methyltransferase [Desulfocucumis palustris]|uniref:5-methyltetrahydrofolate--homocysteine methyltransferase n=1 Tax=Desulfocucumis palustris TaxID=1898651 RepID=A0A2L2XHF5_9FIRM|nr:B12-binding domain-containing protein [Desulfocucumis palustris]GBF33666.1 5-methyltetrahydrofolate--homocysteine methyltransferase [Desulfocucumis palustris]
MENYDFEKLIQAVVDGESEDALELVEDALKRGVSAYEIIDMGLVEGMKIVSDRYDRKQYFVPDLAASAEAMTDALEQLKPLLEVQKEKSKGTVVIGVVQECSQEIGKNIVAAMLSGAGFKVYDLGINVTPRQFVDKAREVMADIVGMGSPMLQTVKYFAETEQLLKQEGLREKIKLLVGGAATNRSTPEKTGTDAWAVDGNEAVKVAESLMEQLRGVQ